jgi:hypothetical protein
LRVKGEGKDEKVRVRGRKQLVEIGKYNVQGTTTRVVASGGLASGSCDCVVTDVQRAMSTKTRRDDQSMIDENELKAIK